MARIRTVKPEIWTDERLTECSVSARLLFIGMLNFADDNGNQAYSAKRLKMQVFPADNIDTQPLLVELITHGLLIEYSVSGEKYLHIKGFTKHQVINRPSKSRIPQPTFSDDSVSSTGVVTDGREGKGKEEEKSPPTPHGGESQPAEPKAKRGNITLADYLAQCRDAGTDPIPESDAVWAYPDTMGLPREYIPLAWWAFQGRYIAGKGEKAKRYTSWPQAFRNAVRENWLHLWWLDQRGGYALTTAGMQAKREMEAVEDAA